MKRIALILLGAVLAISANAQLYNTTSAEHSIITTPKVHPKFEFYGKVGANIMSADWGAYGFGDYPFFAGNKAGVSSKAKFGVDFNFGFMSHFRPTNPSKFYWGAELSITQVGGGFDEFSHYESRYYFEYYLHYPSASIANWGAAIAPTIGWKKEIGNDLALDLHFNPGFLCKFGNKKIEYTEDCYDKDDGRLYHHWVEHDDCGLVYRVQFKGGVGLWFDRFNVDVSYRYLTLFDPSYDIDYSNVIVSVGYRF